jgi:hypothetical protein
MDLPGVAVALAGRGMVPPPRGRGSSPSSQATTDPSNGGSGAADRKGRGVRRDPGMQSLQRWPEAEVDPLHGGGVSSGDSGRGRDEAAVARRERDEWIGGRRRLGRKRLGRERTGWVWDWEGERDFFPFSLFIIFPFYFFSSNYIYYIIKSIISIRDSKWGGILKYMV